MGFGVTELLVGELEHVVLVGALGAQLVDLDGLGLADAVDARHRLHVRVRVGVRDRVRVRVTASVSQEGAATCYALPLFLTTLLTHH